MSALVRPFGEVMALRTGRCRWLPTTRDSRAWLQYTMRVQVGDAILSNVGGANVMLYQLQQMFLLLPSTCHLQAGPSHLLCRLALNKPAPHSRRRQPLRRRAASSAAAQSAAAAVTPLARRA
eukprot:366331-Chlamydomonas_euryale.AAC.35